MEHHKNTIKVLEYLQKTKFLKMAFLIRVLLLKYGQNVFSNENNAFKRNASLFCIFMFFALTFLISNSITNRFTLTWRHSN